MRLLTYTLCAFAGLTSFAYSQTAAVQPAYATNPKFVDALKDAKQLEKERRGVFAEDAYKKANKLPAASAWIACRACTRLSSRWGI